MSPTRFFFARSGFLGARRFLAAALAALLALGLSAAPAASQQQQPARRIRIASEGARPPFNYLDSDNQLAGFEIELAREMCRRMKVECAFVVQDWDSLIGGLEGGQYDAIIAAMEITEERARRIAFAKPYAHTPSALVAPERSAIASAEPLALAGARIGVEADSPQQAYVEDKLKESEVKRYANLEEAMLDLAEGRIDAVADDKLALDDFLENRREGRCCRFVADLPRDEAYFGQGLGVGLRKGEEALKAAFDRALDEIVTDGAYAKIRAKYFDFDIR